MNKSGDTTCASIVPRYPSGWMRAPKSKGGRPPKPVSDATREKIIALYKLGVPKDHIPRYVDVGSLKVRQVLRGYTK